MNQVICQAISEKRILTFTYDGYPRVVEPHAHGMTSKGNEALRCYQTEGGSKSGKVPGWHLMIVNKMEGLTIQDKMFNAPRDGYVRGDKHLPGLHCQL